MILKPLRNSPQSRAWLPLFLQSAVFVFVTIAIAACTVTKIPRFEYASSTPEISGIYRWRIEAEPHLLAVNISGGTSTNIPPASTGQFLAFGLQWVDSIRTNLSTDDHFQFFDNPPVDGVIHVVCYGQVNPEGQFEVGLRRHQPNPRPSIAAPKTEMLHDRTESELGIDALNRIDSVHVILYDASNVVVGQVRMARAESRWADDEEVTASRVAAVIRKLVNGAH